MPSTLILQHVRFEPPGAIADALGAERIPIRYVHVFDGEKVPENLDKISGLVVMGGPMGVYEQTRCPFLRDEIRLIEMVLKKGIPVLGVCLGSQLLASVLGAKVSRGRKQEIGWHRCHLTDAAKIDWLWESTERSFMAFHWHGDVFDLPHDGISLASSDLTAHQAFRYGGNAYGLLFHLEVSEPIIRGMIQNSADELARAQVPARDILTQSSKCLPALRKIGESVFRRWVALLAH